MQVGLQEMDCLLCNEPGISKLCEIALLDNQLNAIQC
jgi:hypothetical protein